MKMFVKPIFPVEANDNNYRSDTNSGPTHQRLLVVTASSAISKPMPWQSKWRRRWQISQQSTKLHTHITNILYNKIVFHFGFIFILNFVLMRLRTVTITWIITRRQTNAIWVPEGVENAHFDTIYIVLLCWNIYVHSVLWIKPLSNYQWGANSRRRRRIDTKFMFSVGMIIWSNNFC